MPTNQIIRLSTQPPEIVLALLERIQELESDMARLALTRTHHVLNYGDTYRKIGSRVVYRNNGPGQPAEVVTVIEDENFKK